MYATGLPDPAIHGTLYDDVPTKRFLAWIVDVIVIALISLALTPLTAFTAILYFPLFYVCVGFAYRTATLARGSATWGMRLCSIELRDLDGERFDLWSAFLHTAGYTASVAMFPLQLVSGVLMVATPRGQGLTDHVMGSAAINRTAS
ncbi:putative RDD family membrane protein YckC [Palleronia aestuarii]|uniref:Putative RDD family membrane protein YckC n=1 Tax=Palleronia aestuarii TaxID=568105 RepID=A0A2W7Q9V8_9RHOB|nr:RDD family protein [Palleronia aestuarii]PZX18519.1 putative RDD family membrane protein YckC [Palleronia aestuarii]